MACYRLRKSLFDTVWVLELIHTFMCRNASSLLNLLFVANIESRVSNTS